MAKVYVVCAALVVLIVAVEFATSVAVFLHRVGDGTLAERAMPDDGAGLVHQIFGLYLLPVVVTGLVISSFNTLYRGATRWALGVAIVFLLDIALASFGILYGAVFVMAHVLGGVALAVIAWHAARRLRTAPPEER